jgi:hypothetical protein
MDEHEDWRVRTDGDRPGDDREGTGRRSSRPVADDVDTNENDAATNDEDDSSS